MSHLSRDERLLALDGALDGDARRRTWRAARRAGPRSRRCGGVAGAGPRRRRARAVAALLGSPGGARRRSHRARAGAGRRRRGWWSPRLAWAAAARWSSRRRAPGYLARPRPAADAGRGRDRRAGRRGSGDSRRRRASPTPGSMCRRRLGAHRGGGRRGRGRRRRSRRRPGSPSCRFRRCPPTSARPWRASWPPNWRRGRNREG